MEPARIAIADARLETAHWGSGEPVLFIQTALGADDLLPVATDAALDGFRRILYHRCGYAGSSAVDGPGSIARDAADGAALLTALDIDRAHIVGLSFSGAIALQLAADAPERVRSLTLIEPPPAHTPHADEFRAANEELVAIRREHGLAEALEAFLSRVIGPDWQRAAEDRLPGSVAQMRRDAGTFFDADLPALLAWRFGPQDASGIDCPVLYVGGTDSGPWFAEVRELLLAWLPHADDVLIDGAGHSLALTHAPQVAEVLAAFLARHRRS